MKKSQKVIDSLSQLLANSYILLAKTQNFHWNVVDPRFHALHALFQDQYEELFEAIDTIAERIRMLQSPAPGTLKEFLKLGILKEATGKLSGDQMIKQLLADHEAIIKEIHVYIQEATKAGDEGTADLLIERVRAHDKFAWMLRSHL